MILRNKKGLLTIKHKMATYYPVVGSYIATSGLSETLHQIYFGGEGQPTVHIDGDDWVWIDFPDGTSTAYPREEIYSIQVFAPELKKTDENL